MKNLLLLTLFLPILSLGGELVVTTRLETLPPDKDDPWADKLGGGGTQKVVGLNSSPANYGSVLASDGREISFVLLDGARIPKSILESRTTLLHDWGLALGGLDESLRKGLSDLENTDKSSPDLMVYSGPEKDLTLAPPGLFVYAMGARRIAIEFLMHDDGAMLLRCRKVVATISTDEHGGGTFYLLRLLGERTLSGSVAKLAGEEYVLLKGRLADELWRLYLEASLKRVRSCEEHRLEIIKDK